MRRAKHLFRPTRQRSHDGIRICECGSLETATVHDVPQQTDEQRAVTARMVGERDEG